mgnify:CR=1 FL=1
MQDITPVPRTPDHLRGVINLRGLIHPVIDLNKKFGLGMAKTKGTVKMLLDLQKILSDKDLSVISKVSEQKNE